jgi:hypothetical protein
LNFATPAAIFATSGYATDRQALGISQRHHCRCFSAVIRADEDRLLCIKLDSCNSHLSGQMTGVYFFQSPSRSAPALHPRLAKPVDALFNQFSQAIQQGPETFTIRRFFR